MPNNTDDFEDRVPDHLVDADGWGPAGRALAAAYGLAVPSHAGARPASEPTPRPAPVGGAAAARHDKPRERAERASPPADPTGRILSLPRLLTDQDVAETLDCSPQTVKRERQRGRLAFIRIGGRIRYTEQQVAAYLQDREESCKVEKAARARSATIGSVSGQTAPCGAAPGSITEHDRHAAHRLAQTILSKPNSRSPRG